ncbi:hypothetical protein [Streptomyces sp. NBC_00847]|uniref:hypothetical protein n=1 Tax=Streptomyces sp. NBC_00847 TaxID=2975850 RepID=UPI00225E0787|nr:hypothetical protein [Streptomyces sp. NBC_00847]MCX4885883.1 hypothetical protein [Streptomyces sp. NBC_00847]
MNAPQKAAHTAQRNQADHWNRRQAEAAEKGPDAVAAVWWDACRMLARKAEKAGTPDVWNQLASHLHDFYRHHTG